MESSESSSKRPGRDIVSVLEECLWQVELARRVYQSLEAVKPAVQQFTKAVEEHVVPAILSFGKALQQAMDKAIADMAVPQELLQEERSDEPEESDG